MTRRFHSASSLARGRTANIRLKPSPCYGPSQEEKDEEERERKEWEEAEAEALKKQTLFGRHIRVVAKKAKYVRRSRRRGAKPKRISKKAQQTMQEMRLVTRPRWPKRAKA